jgi:uncharacterized membrane protein YfcA
MELVKKYHGPLPGDQLLSLFAPGAGASGAVFGIAGALIVLLKSRLLPVPPQELRKLRRLVIYFAAINLVIPFAVNLGARAMHAGLWAALPAGCFLPLRWCPGWARPYPFSRSGCVSLWPWWWESSCCSAFI